MPMRACLEWREGNGITHLTDPTPALPVVKVVFTDRRGGISAPPFDTLNLSSSVGDEHAAVAANRAAMAEATGLPDAHFALARQIHGARVLEVGAGDRGVVGEGDALIARTRGVTVGVLTADCVPVLLASERGIAAVHAGWRGLVGGVIEEAVNRLGSVDCAWIGPSIRGCCYQVGPEVEDAFAARSLPIAGRGRVDPGSAAIEVLGRMGIEPIAAAEGCTSCEARFFSYRRDGITGRQGGFISWA